MGGPRNTAKTTFSHVSAQHVVLHNVTRQALRARTNEQTVLADKRQRRDQTFQTETRTENKPV